jgi:hypothetical protein
VYVVDVKATAIAENLVDAVIAPLLFAVPNGVVVGARKAPVVAVSLKLLISQRIDLGKKTKPSFLSHCFFFAMNVCHSTSEQ